MRKHLVALVMMALLMMGGEAAAQNQEISLDKAAVYPNAVTENGALAPIMLLSYIGDDYYVIPNEQSKQLEPLIEHTVNVKGTVTVDPNGRNLLTITSYKEAFN